MTDTITFNYDEVLVLAADLGHAPEKAGPRILQAFEVAARNVKDLTRAELPKDGAAKAYPYSIEYDIYTNADIFHDLKPGATVQEANSIQADIGPDKSRRQGALGNLLEYGSVNNPAEGNLAEALFEETEDFERGLQKAIEDPL